MDLTSLFNIKGLAIAFAAGLLIGGGGAYFLAAGQFEKAALASANVAVAAQHTQDVKQHAAAVLSSKTAKKLDTQTQANTDQQVLVIHAKGTVLKNIPANCPSDPEVDADVLAAYNKAGH